MHTIGARAHRSFEFIISDKRNDNYDQWFHKFHAPLLALFDKFLCNNACILDDKPKCHTR